MKSNLPLQNSLDKSSTFGGSLDTGSIEDTSFGDMSGLMASMNPDMNVSHYGIGSSVDNSQISALNMDVKQHMDKLESISKNDEDNAPRKLNNPIGLTGLPNNQAINPMGNMGQLNLPNMPSMSVGNLPSTMNMPQMNMGSLNMSSNMPSLPSFSKSNISDMSGKVSDALKSLTSGTDDLPSLSDSLKVSTNTNALDQDSSELKAMIEKLKNEEVNDAQRRKLKIQTAKEKAFGLGKGMTGEKENQPKAIETPKKEHETKKKKIHKHKKKSKKRKLKGNWANENKPNPFARKFDVHLSHVPRRIRCSVTHKKVGKRFEVVNKKKQEYCEAARRKVNNYPLHDLYDYLENMKPTMIQLISVKKTFYCALCDQKKQLNINTRAQTIALTQGTCKTLVTQYQDYLRLHNVIFVKYFNALLQYARCFTTLPGEEQFPKKTLLKEKMERIEYINRCFEHAEDPNFMDYCFYLCDQYSYTSLSSFFDGDLQFLKKINFFLLSFTRKFESNEPMTQEGIPGVNEFANVNFDSPEYMTEQEKEKVIFMGESKDKPEDEEDSENQQPGKWDYQKDIEVEIDEPEEIYEAHRMDTIPDRLRPRFINDYKAINPFDLVNKVDFDIPINDLIQEQCNDHEEEEPLNRNVLQQYFSISQGDIEDFDNDLFLDFADYNYFKIEKKKKEEDLAEMGRKPKKTEIEIRRKAVKNYKEVKPYLGVIEGLTDDDPSEENKIR